VKHGGKSWLKGCAFGCGALLLVPVVIVAVVSVRTLAPLRSAKSDLTQLDSRLGPYTPAPDGAIPAERVEAFIGVRRSLGETCARFESMETRMNRVDALEDRAEHSGEEVADATGGLAGVAVGITPLIGTFFEQRNEALAAAGMSLEEYAYIYAAAFRDRLLDDAVRHHWFFEGGSLSPEAQGALRETLQRQRDGWTGSSTDDGLERLDAEIAAMVKDPRRVSWQDGLPVAVEESLALYRDDLDAVFCRSTAGIDMDRSSRRAIWIALY